MGLLNKLKSFLVGIAKLANPLRVLGDGRANQFLPDTETGHDLILIIAPGQMELPVSGWGAVEEIVLEHRTLFQSMGYRADILNSSNLWHWLQAFFRRPKIVICHYDVLAGCTYFFSRCFGAFFITITHYAYASEPKKWPREYRRISEWLAKSDLFIALSQDIKFAFSQIYPKLKLTHIPNFVRVSDFSFDSPVRLGRAVCVGKVEPRKRQIDLVSSKIVDLNVDFVGPIADPRYEFLDSQKKNLFLGEWSRKELKERLTTYNALILMSDGEADALVAYEAQAAGLSVVLSHAAMGSQDPMLDWVYRTDIESEDLGVVLRKAVSENPSNRNQIRVHADLHYDYRHAVKPWESVLQTSKARTLFWRHLINRLDF